MYLLSNIQYTKEKLNTLYELGVKFRWLGPDAPLIYRWVFWILRQTYLGKVREQWISNSISQFDREFKNLQRVSSIPPRYWDNCILESFEKYILDDRADSIDQCITLYNLENSAVTGRERKFLSIIK